ncbi:hypothetical protein [Actinoplanes sp. NPDC023714]|uniref:hypothetical protein n=1 Tax=Actinoplanes sp. NPDC023714 TaxID=3154322 RepID=UPI0033CF71A1
MTDRRPRVLDASALVELCQGNPDLLGRLDDIEGEYVFAVPTVAIAEAQAVMALTSTSWEVVIGRPQVSELPLSALAAVDAGDIARARLLHHPVHTALIGPLMVGHVIREAKVMGGVVMTRVPEAYGAYDVSITVIE